MRRRAFGLLLILLSACRADSPRPAAPLPGSGDAALTAALHTYVLEFLRRNPTTSTYLGGAGLDDSLAAADGRLRDHSAAALTDEDAWLTTTASQITAMDPAALSPAAAIDREVSLAQIRFLLRQHQARRYQQRALDTYTIEPFRAVDWQLQGMTALADGRYGTAEEWALVVARLQAVPAYLRTARTQLEAGVASGNTPDRRMLQRDGLATARANADYFRTTLPGLAAARMSGPDRDAELAALRTASAEAAAAFLDFHQFVAATFFDDAANGRVKAAFAADRYALGADEYDWALANNFKLSTTAARLFDESWPVVEATRAAMIDLASEIGEARHWPLPADGGAAVRAVFDRLSRDYPTSDTEMVSWYRDAAFRLVDYARSRQLFDVPADYRLDVTVTPPPLEASIDGAAYYPAPPFRQSGVGRFYVTPTHGDAAALKANNRAAIADLSAHEGFPGHDWYYKVLAGSRTRVSPVRWLTPGAVEDSSSMWEDSLSAEGWGLFAEALMAEPQPDAPHGFYTPEERLYQLQGQLYRDLRVRIDTGLHTGRLSYDEATTLFSEIVDYLPGPCRGAAPGSEAKRASCEAAERAIFRYSKWPTQAITYRLGKDQIVALRDEVKQALGERFNAREFYLRFIAQGTIPPGYFGATLRESLTTP